MAPVAAGNVAILKGISTSSFKFCPIFLPCNL
jgi:hypothetical protein